MITEKLFETLSPGAIEKLITTRPERSVQTLMSSQSCKPVQILYRSHRVNSSVPPRPFPILTFLTHDGDNPTNHKFIHTSQTQYYFIPQNISTVFTMKCNYRLLDVKLFIVSQNLHDLNITRYTIAPSIPTFFYLANNPYFELLPPRPSWLKTLSIYRLL